MFSKCLVGLLMRLSLTMASCDNVYYSSDEQLCYGARANSSQDSCTDIPNYGVIDSFAINPVTGEFYAVVLDEGVSPYMEVFTGTDRYLIKFTATVEGGSVGVSTPEQIGDVIPAADISESYIQIAFTCQGLPRLFGLTTDLITTQYLYEIDYENDGNSTELHSWTVAQQTSGAGLFYNIERERFYRLNGNPAGLWEIDPNDPTAAFEVDTYEWETTLLWNNGLVTLASYYNEDLFFTGSLYSTTVFVASLDNTTYVDVADAGNRAFTGTDDIVSSMECADIVSTCMATFSESPSVEPSLMPSYMPSTDPSSMPSSDPSSMPTEMPVEAMMTTEAEVMVDTTMEPEATESSSDDPQPTLADSASKNSISFIMLFVATFAYLFY